ncbi:hypothetical protein ACFQ1S_16690, partial [Kibdelosporangium lantanae]
MGERYRMAGDVNWEQRLILYMDIAGSARPSRSGDHQEMMVKGMNMAVTKGFNEAGVAPGQYDRQGRGDGALILVRPEVVSKAELVSRFVPGLLAELVRHNRRANR